MNNVQILSNVDIEDLCKRFKLKLNACVSKDALRFFPIENGGYVINLDNMGNPGSHWTSLYVRDDIAIYMDPFGVKYPKEIENYCKGYNLIYNETQIQDIKQECCGYYCIAFLHYMMHNVNKTKNHDYFLNRFVSLFNNLTFGSNDNVLQNYFRTKILKI